MKKIVEFSVRFPVTIVMIVLGIGLLGYISYDKLGIDLFPDLNNPRIYVEISAGERPPEEMERQFVENVEALAIRQSGVIEVNSISRVGFARVSVEYSWDKDMDEAFLDLQRALNTYSQNTELDELIISRFDPNSKPVMTVGLSNPSTTDLNELRKTAENYIRNELIRLEGIADVKIAGQEESEVWIETDPYKLEAFGLSTDEIATQINNYNRNVSGGSIEEMSKKYVIKGISLFHDLTDLENLVVAYREDASNLAMPAATSSENTVNRVPVFLKDVATIKFRNSDPLNITRLNGERCLGLSIYKETKYNTVKAVQDLEEALIRVGKALPGYEFQIIQNQGEFISDAIWEVEESALLGIVFAVIILFIFLRRIGSTLIIAIAIPISIIATFNLMFFNELTLNIMTLGGLALGAGMLVDNAIVVLENIYRNLENGLSVKEAAIQGTAQVGGAITASTITTIIVFLPIVYLQGASGELFKDQAWTVAFSLISSLFVALLVIPMLASTFIKSNQEKEIKSVKLGWYGKTLDRILNYKSTILLIALVLIVTGAWMLRQIGSEFMPGAETSEFSIDISLPEGTRLQRTVQAIETVENMILSMVSPEEVILYSHAGPVDTEDAQFSLKGENSGAIKVILTDSASFTSESMIRILGENLSLNPELKVLITRDETALNSIMGNEEAPIEIILSGTDFDSMEKITEELTSSLSKHEFLYNIRSSIDEGMPEIEINIDRLKASMNNISVSSISSQVENRLEGSAAGQLDHEGELKNINIKLPDVSRSELETIKIRSGEKEIPLNDLARIQLSNSPKEINRHNQNRVVFIYADITDEFPFDRVIQKIQTTLDEIQLPADSKLNIEGEEKKRAESMDNLTFAMILSIILVYMVLASQFESLVHPFTILLTIPLAGVGGIMIFFFMGLSLNIMAFIGIIMLAGIAVNDSIILVDAINQLKDSGMQRKEAIIQAGQYRIRPILMTSLTTILALFPLTIGFGESAALRQPMALAVIGGLITSTLLTLVVIPVVYYYFDIFKDWITGKNKA